MLTPSEKLRIVKTSAVSCEPVEEKVYIRFWKNIYLVPPPLILVTFIFGKKGKLGSVLL